PGAYYRLRPPTAAEHQRPRNSPMVERGLEGDLPSRADVGTAHRVEGAGEEVPQRSDAHALRTRSRRARSTPVPDDDGPARAPASSDLGTERHHSGSVRGGRIEHSIRPADGGR